MIRLYHRLYYIVGGNTVHKNYLPSVAVDVQLMPFVLMKLVFVCLSSVEQW